MKAIFVILGCLIAAASCDKEELKRQIVTSLEGCITELNLDKATVVTQLRENVVSEDDNDIANFFSCFSKALETQSEDGEIDFDKLTSFVEVMLKQRLETLEDSKVEEITAAAVKHCKDTPKQESDGLTAIKIRNCIRAFVQKPELH